jgi:hypothetical protein
MLPGTKVYELPQTGLEPRPARWRGCGRGGVLITRSAVHSLGPYFIHGHGYDGCLRHLPPEGPKQALNDRMLLVAEHRRIDRGEPAHDGQCSELRLDGEPVLDGREMGIELRGHANALFVSPFRPAVRRPHFGGFAAVPSDRANESGSAGDTVGTFARPRLPIRSPSSSCAVRIVASNCMGSRVRYVWRRRRLTADGSFGCPSARSYGVAGG